MPLKIEQLSASLRQGLKPVYLFGGAEPLLVQECRDKVRKKAAEQGFVDREILQVDRKFDWDSLAGVAAPSLFAEKKIIDLRLPTGKPGREGGAALSEWAADPDPDRLLIVSCDQWEASSRKSKWASELERAGVRVDIWQVKPNELPAWILGRMRAVGLEPEREAVVVLADRLEGNLLAAQQEIEKLVLLKGEGPISTEDVLESVADNSRFDSFLLAERILSGNLADGLRVAAGLHRTGVAIQLVNGALVRELRTLEAFQIALSAGESEPTVFRKLNVWHSRQTAMRQAARRINGLRLASAFGDLARMDQQSKGRAQGNPWHELDRLVCSLCA